MSKDWFAANKDGLRQIAERQVARRGFGVVGSELYQNVRDTSATECIITVEKIPGKPRIKIRVEDNGEGFADLTHAWMMFAPSAKKDDPEKAGRFNMGEKVVLSFAYEAEIHTTSGTVVFNSEGRKEKPRRKRHLGTVFYAELACNEERYQQLLDSMRTLVVKPGLDLFVNGELIGHREPIHTFSVPLKTEIGDDLRPSIRTTMVEVYEPSGDEVPSLYELGIPVVDTGDKWHVNVCQKVPLNIDRDNVTPAYLRSVRVAVFNEMHNRIEDKDTEATWVNEATSDDDCKDEAAASFIVKKYGEKSVASDPTNPEADGEALSHGYTVIPSRGLTRGQRDNLYRGGNLKSSSKQFPTAGKGVYSDDPNAIPVTVIDPEKYTLGMSTMVKYTEYLGQELLGKNIVVRIVNCNSFGGGKRWLACYGRGHLSSGHLDFNVFTLGKKWFDKGFCDEVNSLIIHEFGHDFSSNHLCEEYYDGLCDLGARFGRLVMEKMAHGSFKIFTE